MDLRRLPEGSYIVDGTVLVVSRSSTPKYGRTTWVNVDNGEDDYRDRQSVAYQADKYIEARIKGTPSEKLIGKLERVVLYPWRYYTGHCPTCARPGEMHE